MELTDEEKNIILKMREEKETQEDGKKIVKVGILKHDISKAYYIGSDFSNLLDTESSGNPITRKWLTKQIEKINKIFDQYSIKKGTKFFCTIEGGLEYWSDEDYSYEDLTEQWAKENLENIQLFDETR